MSCLKGKWLALAAVAFAFAWPSSLNITQAQDEVTAKDWSEAADAYDRGSSAYLSNKFAEAAHWFERAYRLAPSTPALMQAIRANDEAGYELRTANLALQLQAEASKNADARAVYRPLIRHAKSKYVQINTRCDKPCDIEIDGGVVGHHRFFAAPNKSHKVVADFGYARRTLKTTEQNFPRFKLCNLRYRKCPDRTWENQPDSYRLRSRKL